MTRFWLIPLALAFCVLAPFAIWGDGLEALFSGDGAVAALRDNAAAGWIVGAGLLVVDLFAPIPTTAVIAALGIVYGPVLGAAAALFGTLLAASLGYAIGRFLGRPAAARLVGGALEDGERLFVRHGGWIVAASRWAPVLPEVVSVVAGVARMPFPAFLAAAFCGALPLCALFAGIGWLGADAPGWTLIFSALAPLAIWLVAEKAGWTRRLGLRP